MTLIEAVLKNTGCTSAEELIKLPPGRRKQLADALRNIPAGKVPPESWNTLLTAFGAPPQDSSEKAREKLLLLLSSAPAAIPKNTSRDSHAFLDHGAAFIDVVNAVVLPSIS